MKLKVAGQNTRRTYNFTYLWQPPHPYIGNCELKHIEYSSIISKRQNLQTQSRWPQEYSPNIAAERIYRVNQSREKVPFEFCFTRPSWSFREIYQKSNRINRNFLVINCANAALIQGDFNSDKTASVSGMHFQVSSLPKHHSNCDS